MSDYLDWSVLKEFQVAWCVSRLANALRLSQQVLLPAKLPHISFRGRNRSRTSQPEDWMHRFPVEGPVAHVYADMLNVSRWTRCLNAPSV